MPRSPELVGADGRHHDVENERCRLDGWSQESKQRQHRRVSRRPGVPYRRIKKRDHSNGGREQENFVERQGSDLEAERQNAGRSGLCLNNPIE